MLNKQGGLEADLTVSTLDGSDQTQADSGLFPVSNFELVNFRIYSFSSSSLITCCNFNLQSNVLGNSPVFYLNAAGGAAFHNLSHVRQTIQDAGFKDVRVDDVSRDLGLLSLQGPEARNILGKVVAGGEAALSNEAFPFYTHKVIEVAGHKVRDHAACVQRKESRQTDGKNRYTAQRGYCAVSVFTQS